MDWLLIIATILAFFVKGMSGFANTLVFSSIVGLARNNVNITPLELILGYPSNIVIAYRERRGLDIKIWGPLAFLVIMGSIPGTLYLKYGDVTTIKRIFGVVIILLGIEMMFREFAKKHHESSKAVLTLIGLISGLLCGLFGIGAFLAAYISRTTKNMSEFKGNICFVFLIENTFRILLYAYTGIIRLEILKDAITLLPFMLVGLLLGFICSKRVSETITKRIVVSLIIVMGIVLLIKG